MGQTRGQALAAKGRHHNRSCKHTLDRIHHTVALLLHRRDVAPYPAELRLPGVFLAGVRVLAAGLALAFPLPIASRIA